MYKDKEGITLENVSDPPNPGRKQVAKLMLNSLWGKFGQRENLPQMEQVVQPHQLYKILTDSANDVQELRFCSEERDQTLKKDETDR